MFILYIRVATIALPLLLLLSGEASGQFFFQVCHGKINNNKNELSSRYQKVHAKSVHFCLETCSCHNFELSQAEGLPVNTTFDPQKMFLDVAGCSSDDDDHHSPSRTLLPHPRSREGPRRVRRAGKVRVAPIPTQPAGEAPPLPSGVPPPLIRVRVQAGAEAARRVLPGFGEGAREAARKVGMGQSRLFSGRVE